MRLANCLPLTDADTLLTAVVIVNSVDSLLVTAFTVALVCSMHVLIAWIDSRTAVYR